MLVWLIAKIYDNGDGDGDDADGGGNVNNQTSTTKPRDHQIFFFWMV